MALRRPLHLTDFPYTLYNNLAFSGMRAVEIVWKAKLFEISEASGGTPKFDGHARVRRPSLSTRLRYKTASHRLAV